MNTRKNPERATTKRIMLNVPNLKNNKVFSLYADSRTVKENNYDLYLLKAIMDKRGPAALFFRDYERMDSCGLLSDPNVVARYWITTNSSPTIETVAPTAIARIASHVQSSFAQGTPTVVLEGMEYLVSQNNYNGILNLIQLMNDKVMLSKNSVVILPLDPATLTEPQLAYIRKETNPLNLDDFVVEREVPVVPELDPRLAYQRGSSPLDNALIHRIAPPALNLSKALPSIAAVNGLPGVFPVPVRTPGVRHNPYAPIGPLHR